MSNAETIGFIGIGNMGAPMVRCLLKAGREVCIYDANRAALKVFDGGADRLHVASSLGDVGARATVVITMLPNSEIVRAVVMGAGGSPGLVQSLRPGAIIVDMSSSYAPDTVALGAELAARSFAMIDAPVSGGVGKAVSGTLAIMAGGAAVDVDRVDAILSAMGTVHRTGKLGSGHALKCLNNYVSAAGLIATCEALTIGKSFGLDPVTMTKVFNASTGRNNTTENKAERYLIPGQFDSGFALALMSKDVGMAQKLGAQLGLDARELDFVTQYLNSALTALGLDADHTAVMSVAGRPRS